MRSRKRSPRQAEARDQAGRKAETEAHAEACTPKPAPKPAPKPKNTDPFRELAAAVELPLLEDKAPPVAQATEPFLIGRVHVPDDTSWDLTLLGREHALKGTRQFLALEKGEVDGKASWPVQLEVSAPGQDTTKTPVARFWRDKTALNFQWLPGAEADTANHLRNCLLAGLPARKDAIDHAQQTAGGAAAGDRPEPRPGPDGHPVEVGARPEYLRLEITGFEGHKTIKTEPEDPGPLKTPDHAVPDANGPVQQRAEGGHDPREQPGPCGPG